MPAAHLDFCLQVSLTVEPRELPLVQLPAPPLPSELRGQFQPPRRATSAREPPTHSWVRRVSRSHPRGNLFLLMILPSTWGIPIRVGFVLLAVLPSTWESSIRVESRRTESASLRPPGLRLSLRSTSAAPQTHSFIWNSVGTARRVP